MLTTEQFLFESFGVPDVCPICHMTNWEFSGAVDTGITRVSCRTCGRQYKHMTWRQAVKFLATRLAFITHDASDSYVDAAYARLENVYRDAEFGRVGGGGSVLVVEGSLDGDEDELPF